MEELIRINQRNSFHLFKLGILLINFNKETGYNGGIN